MKKTGEGKAAVNVPEESRAGKTPEELTGMPEESRAGKMPEAAARMPEPEAEMQVESRAGRVPKVAARMPEPEAEMQVESWAGRVPEVAVKMPEPEAEMSEKLTGMPEAAAGMPRKQGGSRTAVKKPSGRKSTGDSSKELSGGKLCCEKRKHRNNTEISDLIHRLNRVEGQIRGIRSMVESDAYCIDILTQVSAAGAALNAFSRVLLDSHVRTCVVEDIRSGSNEKTEELLAVLQKFMR